MVAACRDAGMTLKKIQEAREYIATQFKSEFPFAQYRFKTDGKELLLPYEQIDPETGTGKLMNPHRQGQMAWDEIIGPRLKEFEYEGDLAIRWRVAGTGSPIVIDPRVAFGAPTLKGVPTWLMKERWEAGEDTGDTADDFGLTVRDVKQGLEFEGVDLKAPRTKKWLN